MESQKLLRKELLEALARAAGGNAALGRKLGYKDGALIWQMLNDVRPISEKFIAKVHGVRGWENWFSQPAAPAPTRPNNAPPTPDNTADFGTVMSGDRLATKPLAKLPVVGEVRGGSEGYLEELQYPVGHGEGVVEHPTADPNAYALRVRGDSMHPRYRAGEFVIVEPNIEAQPGDDVVVLCVNGRKLLKELNWKRDGEVQLLSINNGYDPLTLSLSEIMSIQLVAGRARRSALIKG